MTFLVDEFRATGLPDTSLLSEVEETLRQSGKSFQISPALDLIQEVNHILNKIETQSAMADSQSSIANIYGSNIKLCDMCHKKPGTMR